MSNSEDLPIAKTEINNYQMRLDSNIRTEYMRNKICCSHFDTYGNNDISIETCYLLSLFL
jgi:hypothetical protein